MASAVPLTANKNPSFGPFATKGHGQRRNYHDTSLLHPIE
jgi:hypothetical protein